MTKIGDAKRKLHGMIIGKPDETGEQIADSSQVYIETEGACGSASVIIASSHPFATWLDERGHGMHNPKSLGGGFCIFVRDHNQSLLRKEAHAEAFAKILKENGIEAKVESRMD